MHNHRHRIPIRQSLFLMVLICIALLLLPATGQAASVFPDVNGHWAEAEINYLYGQGVIGGLPDGTFGVNLPITRAQAAKMIAFEQHLADQAASFADVPSSHWASGVIGAVAAAGLMSGYPDGLFHPDRQLTRAEAAAILANTFDLSATPAAATFSDVGLSHWASGSVEGMVANFVAAGYPDGSFRPGHQVSRGEFSVFLARILFPDFQAQLKLVSRSAMVVQALHDQDLAAIQPYVHPVKGLRFSPYNYVQSSDLVFPASAMPGFLADTTLFNWGIQDGSGFPIVETTADYFPRYVFNKDYTQPDEIQINNIVSRGSLINNITTFYPNASIVEYFVSGTEVYGGMDWGSLYLIYEDFSGFWYLVGIVHGEWTT